LTFHGCRFVCACVLLPLRHSLELHCPQKNIARSFFSIILVTTEEISPSPQLQLHFHRSLCNTLTCDIIMTSCRDETETVSRMEKAGPFDCCCSRHSVSSIVISLLVSGLTGDILSTFVAQCVQLMRSKFMFFCGHTVVRDVCLHSVCNCRCA